MMDAKRSKELREKYHVDLRRSDWCASVEIPGKDWRTWLRDAFDVLDDRDRLAALVTKLTGDPGSIEDLDVQGQCQLPSKGDDCPCLKCVLDRASELKSLRHTLDQIAEFLSPETEVSKILAAGGIRAPAHRREGEQQDGSDMRNN